MPSAEYYKRKAAALTKERDAALLAVQQARQLIDAANLRMADRAVLLSITRDGRRNKFLFERNGQLTRIETMGTWDDDVQGWQKALLHRQDAQ